MQLGLAFYITFEFNLASTWLQLGVELRPEIDCKSILRGSKIGLKFQDSKMTHKSFKMTQNDSQTVKIDC